MASAGSIGRVTANRYLAALAYRDFRTMWLATLAAQAAYWSLIVTRGWVVFDMTHSSMSVGIVTFAAMIPMVIVPPFAGVVADRLDRRTVLAWTYGVNLLHNLVLAMLALTGLLSEWQIVALSLVNGTARSFQMATSQALAANLVPSDKLLNALSLNSATMHGSRLIGPGLTTPLLAILGAPAAFLLCTALYAVGWWQIMRIETRSRGGVRAGENFLQSFGAGLRYVADQPLIRMVMVMVIFHCGLTMAFESLLPNFSHQRLHAGATGFSTMMMAVGAGALVGSIMVGGIQSTLTRGRLYFVMGVLSGLGQVLLAFTTSAPTALAALALMGGTQAAFMTMGQAITQALAADEYRGRIASINVFSLGGVMSVMNLANGALGSELSAAAILLANGLLFSAIMVMSIAAATPRRVYMHGLPGEAAVASAV